MQTDIPRVKLYWIVLVLVLAGLSLTWLRHTHMQIPLKPGKDTVVWLVEARVDFTASQRPVLASLSIPNNPPGFGIFNEQAASPGYGFSIVENKESRRAEWSRRTAAGPQTLYYKIQITPQAENKAPAADPPSPLAPVYWEASEAMAARAILDSSIGTSSSPESLTRELVKSLNAEPKRQNAALLLTRHSPEDLLTRLLAQAGIPARTVQGLFLEAKRRNQSLVPMVEVFNGREWVLFHPETGVQGVPVSASMP